MQKDLILGHVYLLFQFVALWLAPISNCYSNSLNFNVVCSSLPTLNINSNHGSNKWCGSHVFLASKLKGEEIKFKLYSKMETLVSFNGYFVSSVGGDVL